MVMTPEEKKLARTLLSQVKSVAARTYDTTGKKITEFDKLNPSQMLKDFEAMSPAKRAKELKKAQDFVTKFKTDEQELRNSRTKNKVNPQTGRVGF
jgi:ClpP class serine protease